MRRPEVKEESPKDGHESLSNAHANRSRAAPCRSPIPPLAAFPLHGNARRIANLHPDRAWPGSIGAINLLGNDSLGTQPASVLEHGRAIPGNVFVEQDVSVGTAQQTRQCGLAVQEREIAQIPAILLDQVEGIEARAMCALGSAQFIEAR